MAYKIRLLSKAEKDISEALEWYAEIEPSLASRFLIELDNGLMLIKDFPQAFPIVHADLRMYVMKAFPFKVIYLVEQEAIVVHAIKHHKLHPEKWKKK